MKQTQGLGQEFFPLIQTSQAPSCPKVRVRPIPVPGLRALWAPPAAPCSAPLQRAALRGPVHHSIYSVIFMGQNEHHVVCCNVKG